MPLLLRHPPIQVDVPSGAYRLVMNHRDHCQCEFATLDPRELDELPAGSRCQDGWSNRMKVSVVEQKMFEAGV